MRSRRRRLAPPAVCLVLLGSLTLLQAGASAQGGGAAPKNCVGPQNTNPPCVMMIQIDGLEASDVTPQNTPFLWSLAHPDGDGNDDNTPEVPATDGSQQLNEGRNGWIWQAPRASMTAGLAANAASFLVGGYTEQTGIPSDELVREGERLRLGGPDTHEDDSVSAITAGDVVGQSILSLVREQLGDPETGSAETAAYVGDPNLGQMVIGELGEDQEVDHGWYPTPVGAGAPAPQNPALCDIPRDPLAAPGGTDGQSKACAASDAQTLAQAFQGLQNAPNVLLTYIELAELGRMKRASAQVDAAGAMAQALRDMDTALGTFLNGYASPASATTAGKWDNTIVMISGTSGYEQTLPNQRVPDPDAADEGQDLANHVGQFGGGNKFELIPQGSVATVYPAEGVFNDSAAAPSQAHRDAVAALKAELQGNQAAACGAEGCIEEVLYMRPELTPTGSAAGTVEDAHPDWHLDHLDISDTEPRVISPSGQSGDLLVVMKPGWGAGKAVPTEGDLSSGNPTTNLLTNPYPASTGGPRNRAVAAIVNGFTGNDGVRSLDDEENRAAPGGGQFDRFPIAAEEEQGAEDDPECTADPSPPAEPFDVAAANATPGDDANATGHWCQAEVLDFAPTVAALLEVAMPADQICGRLLNEAFNSELTPSQDEDAAPDAFFTSGPVTPPEGQTYPQSDANATFEFDTTAKTRTVIDCGDETVIDTSFECKLDTADYAPCTSPSTIGPLPKGIHEYCVRSVSDTLLSEPECAKFEVITFFDFEGLLRDLRAKVTDYDGNTFKAAPKKRVLNRIQISGDYGRPLSAVTLTLYKQTTGKKLCGSPVFRPLSAAKSAPCPLTGLARFKPFKLDRGHVDLRLRIPPGYKPTHVGVTVQEVAAKVLTPAQQAGCKKSESLFCMYEPVGTAEGGIVKIVGAGNLHKVKGGKKKKKKRKRKRK
jgi:hypothetical protein